MKLTVIDLIQNHTVAWMNVQLIFLKYFKKFLHTFFRVSWSNVSDIAGVPVQIASAE